MRTVAVGNVVLPVLRTYRPSGDVLDVREGRAMAEQATVETDCPVCGVRLCVPVIEVPGAEPRRTADLLWLVAHFRTHDPGGGGERDLCAA